MSGWTSVAILLCLSAPLSALAAAPVLPSEMATSANNLQRAVWACEAGGQALSKPGERFFLGVTDNDPSQAAKPPLSLQGSKLSGFGQISNDRGWFNIQFDCTLRPDLRQAAEFNFAVLSPVQPADQPAPEPQPTKIPNAAETRWSVRGSTPVQLVHGAGQNQDFLASCVPASNMVRIALGHSLPHLRPGNFVTAGITDGPNSALYVAEIGAGKDAMPSFILPAHDPLLGWMGKGAALHINLGGEDAYDVSQKDSATAVASFLTACR
jgi:hypothetical protein